MEGYATEDEELQKIRDWWNKNGKSVILGIVVGLTAMFGTRMFMNSQEAEREEASALFEAVMSGLEQEDYQVVMERGGAVVSQYSGTPYAPLASLAMAKAKYSQDDLAAAENYLRWAVDNTSDTGVAHVARLRLASLLWEQDKADAALNLLSGIDAGPFTGRYEELRGDILASQGRMQEARESYRVAIDAPEYAGDRNILQMKLDNLGGGEAPPPQS